jgi:hypothetical protein
MHMHVQMAAIRKAMGTGPGAEQFIHAYLLLEGWRGSSSYSAAIQQLLSSYSAATRQLLVAAELSTSLEIWSPP